MKEPLVIVGNGMAAGKLVQQLIAIAPTRFAITVIGDEPGLAYNRIMLSPLLASSINRDSLSLMPRQWWAENGVRILSGRAVRSIDIETRNARLSNRRCIPFSKLVFATGSRAFRLPIPGADIPGVHAFRTLLDVDILIALAEAKSAVSVIGGGLLGIEAAYGLAKRGARVTLVHLMDRLMERQLDHAAAAMVKQSLERQGIEVILEAQSENILGQGKAQALRLADGRAIEADAVVMAAGIKPNAELAKEAGLAVNRGIVVDERLRTSAEGVYAIGECAEAGGQCCGLVAPAYIQADMLARHLCGDEGASFAPEAAATHLKVSGLPVFSAGDFLGGQGSSQILLRDPGAGLYKKFVLRDGVLAGAVLVGDTDDSGWYLNLIRDRTPVAPFRSGLAFGEAFSTPLAEMAA